MDGCQDFRPGYLFAPADDLAVIRILPYHLFLFLFCHLRKTRNSFSHRIKLRIGRQLLPFFHKTDRMTGNGDCRRKTRRLNAHQINGAGRNVIPYLYLKILYNTVLIHPFRQNTGIAADIILFMDTGPQV